MSEMTHEDALAHFGVKGMKWGHHKASVPGQTRKNVGIAIDKAHHAAKIAGVAQLAILGGIVLAGALQATANHAVQAKMASNGAKAAARLFSDTNGIANLKMIDLGWDAVTGSWK